MYKHLGSLYGLYNSKFPLFCRSLVLSLSLLFFYHSSPFTSFSFSWFFFIFSHFFSIKFTENILSSIFLWLLIAKPVLRRVPFSLSFLHTIASLGRKILCTRKKKKKKKILSLTKAVNWMKSEVQIKTNTHIHTVRIHTQQPKSIFSSIHNIEIYSYFFLYMYIDTCIYFSINFSPK